MLYGALALLLLLVELSSTYVDGLRLPPRSMQPSSVGTTATSVSMASKASGKRNDSFTSSDLANEKGDQAIDDILTSSDVSFLRIITDKEYTASSSERKQQSSVSTEDELSTENFGSIFRQCAPYIAMHRGW